MVGGHFGRTHKDFGTLEYLIRRFSPKSGVDVGCGPGGMVQAMRRRGVPCIGIDGDPSLCLAPPSILHDFTTGPLQIGPTDLCWSVEFLEHITESDLANVWSVFRQCRVIFCTHATDEPENDTYHVNCQPEEYWVAAFDEQGYELDHTATSDVRRASTMVRDFARLTGKVFVRREEKLTPRLAAQE